MGILGIGIIGCGGMGRMHCHACVASEGVEVRAVYDAVGEKALALGKDFNAAVEPSIHALLIRPDIDAVFVTTPTPYHHDNALAVIEAGKHLFLEKPIARTLKQARDIVDAANAASLVCIVGQVVRYTPQYELLRDAYLDGRWGKLQAVRFERVCGLPGWETNGWFTDETQSGGAILDMHVHDTDFILYTLGLPGTVETRGIRNESGWFHTTTLYGFPGVYVEAQGTWYNVQNYPFHSSFVAIFEEGVLELDGTRDFRIQFHPRQGEPFTPETKPMPEGKVEAINISSLGAYLLEDQAFFEAVRTGDRDTRASLNRAFESFQVVMCEIQSVEKGAVVPVTVSV